MKEEYWRAIVECNPDYDGIFLYGLKTTKIFCRPSCKSKTPLRQNVNIYHCSSEALKDGLRPCKRCNPDNSTQRPFDVVLVEQIQQYIRNQYHEDLTLSRIAARFYVSPFYLQRCFKRIIGVSPTKFLTLTRIQAAQSILKDTDKSITSIALTIGFHNSAYFSTVFQKETGYSPSEFRHRLKHTGKVGQYRCISNQKSNDGDYSY